MNFSENFKLTSRGSLPLPVRASSGVLESHPLVKFSPSGIYVANAVQFRLIVRDAINTLEATHMFTCLDAIQSIEWSPDSQLILCCMQKRGLLQIWCLDQPDWSCKIDEGSAGLQFALWSPDSSHILTMADFNVRMTVWSLTSKSVSYIKHLSKAGLDGIAFSPDGRYMALAERRDCKDALAIFDLSTWSLAKHFPLATKECAGVVWKPSPTRTEHAVAVWEGLVFGFDLILYSLCGAVLGRLDHATFNDAFSHRHQLTSLGPSGLSFSPCGQLAASGSSDPYCPSVLILNSLTWRRVIELHMTSSFTVGPRDNEKKKDIPHHSNTVVYREINKRVPVALDPGHPLAREDISSLGTLYAHRSRFETLSGHVNISSIVPDPDKVLPSPLVSISFSPDTTFLASRSETMQNVLWIWDVRNLRLASVLILSSPVKSFGWSPDSGDDDTSSRLAVVSSTQNLYMWSVQGALSVQVPSDVNLELGSLSWSPDGSSLALTARDAFCLCFCTEVTRLSPREVVEHADS